jgi:hypothetical protein
MTFDERAGTALFNFLNLANLGHAEAMLVSLTVKLSLHLSQ